MMQIVDLRRELECRSVSSKGLKSQLIARLTKALKTEQEKEEEQEATEAVSGQLIIYIYKTIRSINNLYMQVNCIIGNLIHVLLYSG